MSIISSPEDGHILQTTFGFKKTRGVFETLSMTSLFQYEMMLKARKVIPI
ncbi:MAG: hypothetical protein V3V18_01880 [Methylococcales bacterium]